MNQKKSNIKIQKAHKTLLMIGMFSIVMLFAGLTSAYIVSKGSLASKWDYINLPEMFYISTFFIIVSSFFAEKSVTYAKQNNFKLITRCLLFAILLGFLFTLFQFFGWSDLINNGKFFTGNNVASSYIYVLTFTHIFHLLAGIIVLLVGLFQAYKKKYNSKNLHGLKLSVRFWHFLTVLWVYIFLFLLLIN